ncbi:SNF7 family protein [Entamoeba histolytica HM-3:IMSS]|uniref:SNF7 family protein n=5 Tax=Entamoeba histolytica TaxID=5759 RepID=C4M2Y2_ENTH1|nr:SNF7 family protein [Entamoeba histolytica HM-1:IMSS]EMD44080.1 SNF7 family protein [Entamoeba histolytica KU27]EMS15740.1 SNF7 family protein [Entamoeba histolytica HM-3:IMSS]ENY65799.1 SNF7 family protein, putative [Entamoeba histolytica HM-1:IMSS-A]GAT95655.1 snf7 family protein [Entamoeba histolytica]EAL47347.1 SNF7 family protein [Entamoeba histolytica HM-1:IMSS]|eukprot:XP_652734.1 SNF7 family protein [Entamoeba histolytica HM-1:IMSS]
MGNLNSQTVDNSFQQKQFELKVNRDNLSKREKEYQNNIEKLNKEARKYCRKGDKENAKRQIKLRTLYETNLKEIRCYLDQTETILIQLEASKRNYDVAKLMDESNKEIKKILNKIPKNFIEEIINTKKENSDKLKEIDSLYEQLNDIDNENQIEQELNKLALEVMSEKEGGIEAVKNEVIAESLPEVNSQSDMLISKQNIVIETF